MSYREGFKENLDWVSAYLEFRQNGSDNKDNSPADVSKAKAAMDSFRAKLEAKDKFVPQTLGNFDSTDIDKLWELRKKLLEFEISGVGFYQECRRTIEKIITLLCEQSPDELNVLDKAQKSALFSAKMDMPTERELYQNAYALFLGHRRSPHISSAMKFDEIIAIQLEGQTRPGNTYREEPKPSQLAEKIKAVDAEYRRYFLQNDPRNEQVVIPRRAS